MSEHVRVEMRRSGGFAGRGVHVRLDSEQMPPTEAARLADLVRPIDLSRLHTAAPATHPGADLMRYDLTIERGSHRWHGTVADPAVPNELRPLLQFLTASAR